MGRLRPVLQTVAASLQSGGRLGFRDLCHEATSRLLEKSVFGSMEMASITGYQTLAMLKRYMNSRAKDLAKKLG